MSGLPYIGSKISLISNAEIRYEGTLYTINTGESTIALQHVKSFGTEGRKTPEIPKSNEVYQFIIFRGKDIKDLTVLSGQGATKGQGAFKDPAVVSVNQAPLASKGKGKAAAPAKGGGGNFPFPVQYQQSYQQQSWGGWDAPAKGKGKSAAPMASKGKGKGAPQAKGGKDKGGKSAGKGGKSAGADAQRRRGGNGPRNPVGELIPNESSETKAEFTTNFDFEEANKKMDKPAEATTFEVGYNKSSSFFDTISSDAARRKAGQEQKDQEAFRLDRDKQREVDKDTFGATALKRPFGRRGGGRGRGGRRY